MLLLRFYCVRCSMPLVFGVRVEGVDVALLLALFCPVVDAAIVSGDDHARPIVS